MPHFCFRVPPGNEIATLSQRQGYAPPIVAGRGRIAKLFHLGKIVRQMLKRKRKYMHNFCIQFVS